MDHCPFTPHLQLYTKLTYNPKQPSITRISSNAVPGALTTKTTLPEQPRVGLNDPKIGDFLQKELATPDLNKLAPHLWLLAKQDSSHVSSLSHQIVRGRSIIVTENPELHLVWIYDRIYIKPLPVYLFSHAFWEYYLVSNESPIPASQRLDIVKAAQGFLRSYSYLIQHKSDFLLAQSKQHRLLPENISYSKFIRFITEFEVISDADVAPRYAFGELRLTRLNFWAKFFLRRFAFQKVYGQYGAYFSRFYGPILFVFGVLSVALNSMQVAVSVQPLVQFSQSWITFAELSRVFSVCTLVCVALVALFLLSILLMFSLREIHYAAKDRYKRMKQKRNQSSPQHEEKA